LTAGGGAGRIALRPSRLFARRIELPPRRALPLALCPFLALAAVLAQPAPPEGSFAVTNVRVFDGEG
jgi:hypothetical protein